MRRSIRSGQLIYAYGGLFLSQLSQTEPFELRKEEAEGSMKELESEMIQIAERLRSLASATSRVSSEEYAEVSSRVKELAVRMDRTRELYSLKLLETLKADSRLLRRLTIELGVLTAVLAALTAVLAWKILL